VYNKIVVLLVVRRVVIFANQIGIFLLVI